MLILRTVALVVLVCSHGNATLNETERAVPSKTKTFLLNSLLNEDSNANNGTQNYPNAEYSSNDHGFYGEHGGHIGHGGHSGHGGHGGHGTHGGHSGSNGHTSISGTLSKLWQDLWQSRPNNDNNNHPDHSAPSKPNPYPPPYPHSHGYEQHLQLYYEDPTRKQFSADVNKVLPGKPPFGLPLYYPFSYPQYSPYPSPSYTFPPPPHQPGGFPASTLPVAPPNQPGISLSQAPLSDQPDQSNSVITMEFIKGVLAGFQNPSTSIGGATPLSDSPITAQPAAPVQAATPLVQVDEYVPASSPHVRCSSPSRNDALTIGASNGNGCFSSERLKLLKVLDPNLKAEVPIQPADKQKVVNSSSSVIISPFTATENSAIKVESAPLRIIAVSHTPSTIEDDITAASAPSWNVDAISTNDKSGAAVIEDTITQEQERPGMQLVGTELGLVEVKPVSILLKPVRLLGLLPVRRYTIRPNFKIGAKHRKPYRKAQRWRSTRRGSGRWKKSKSKPSKRRRNTTKRGV